LHSSALGRPRFGVRAHVRRACGHALLRPRPRARLRTPVAARRDSAPMKRLGVVVLLALAFPAGASAHASLENASPSFRQRVETAPKDVQLSFDQIVKPLANSIVVFTARGRVVSLPARSGANAHQVVARLDRLAPGP